MAPLYPLSPNREASTGVSNPMASQHLFWCKFSICRGLIFSFCRGFFRPPSTPKKQQQQQQQHPALCIFQWCSRAHRFLPSSPNPAWVNPEKTSPPSLRARLLESKPRRALRLPEDFIDLRANVGRRPRRLRLCAKRTAAAALPRLPRRFLRGLWPPGASLQRRPRPGHPLVGWAARQRASGLRRAPRREEPPERRAWAGEEPLLPLCHVGRAEERRRPRSACTCRVQPLTCAGRLYTSPWLCGPSPVCGQSAQRTLTCVGILEVALHHERSLLGWARPVLLVSKGATFCFLFPPVLA
ncbi:uncharacterized protein LOC125431262 [Sphaerodactylus townsendi]|uniref:uncharacterized protein LOC125431262 n=1 Tax=Sphaerodactylus townsendi TaxID=933632 RepID=UPI002025F303|nr:uncharacterized protein LOC125431262 [Sphaerodactylus townsendi]